jgi:hypothetical protein
MTFNTQEKGPDEWDLLLSRSSYWKTTRVTAWALRFVSNARARKQKTNLATVESAMGEEGPRRHEFRPTSTWMGSHTRR